MPDAVEIPGRVSPESGRTAIICHNVTKDFGSVRALDGINLEVRAGTVHALVGENGAGKSTLLGVLAGRISPTSGTVHLFGLELPYGVPRVIRSMGVAAIYQELMIAPTLSAQSNVYLGQPIAKRGVLMEKAMRHGFDRLCARFGEQIPADVPAGTLSVAQQQLLEIMRGLVASARLILFDEPTASLPPRDREALFRVMADLRADGVTIMFVSHNLDEVLGIADVVTVFRDGRLAATAPAKEWTKSSLVAKMLGRELAAKESAEATGGQEAQYEPSRNESRVLVRVEGLTVLPAIQDINFEIRRGEIVGLGGLVGSGRTTVLRALAGLQPNAKGRLWIEGKEVPWPHTVRQARGFGIALLPEDRKGEGLVLTMCGADNVVMSDFRTVARAGFISHARTMARASAASADFGIAANRLSEMSANLSGGNQQKLLFARWKHCPPKVLLADEPTRGIDVGAKVEILESLQRLAAEGKAIAFVSSELEEVAAICDRVIVLAEGRQVGEILGKRGETTVQDILRGAFGVEAAVD